MNKEGAHTKIVLDTNRGRVFVRDSQLERVNLNVGGKDAIEFDLVGKRLRCRKSIESIESFETFYGELLENLAPAMSVYLHHPVVLGRSSVLLGDTRFQMQIRDNFAQTIRGDRQADHEQRIREGLERYEVFNAGENRRLLAGAAYLHAAMRLREVGHLPSEFLAEIVLNLSKCMEVLFPSSNDQRRECYRNELRRLGFSPEEVEGVFIPITILRNSFDVGHPTTREFDVDLTLRLGQALVGIEHRFQELISRLAEKVSKSEYEVVRVIDTAPSQEDTKLLARLVESLESRRGPKEDNRR